MSSSLRVSSLLALQCRAARLRQPIELLVCALVFQACAEAARPSEAPPECASTAAELSRSYVRLEHRSAPSACDASRPCTPIRPWFCRSHADCSAGDNGRCSADGFECTYDECRGDEDCPSDALCDCAGGRDASHRCLPVECRTDRDCPGGLWCSPSPAIECPQPVVGYYCHTSMDECAVDAYCGGPFEYCAFDSSRRAWVCATQRCER